MVKVVRETEPKAAAGRDAGLRWVNDGEPTETLQLPPVFEDLEEVAAASGTKVADLTFLDVALGVVARLEASLKSHREREELRFLRSCLKCGHAGTLQPVSASVDRSGHSGASRRSLQSNSRSSAQLEHLGVGGAELSEERPSELPKTLRTGFQYRGALQRTRYLQLASAQADMHTAMEAQAPLARCPWMGPVIPRWPAEDLSDDVAKSLDQLISQEFNEWGFDVFLLSQRSGARPLTFTGWEALLRVGAFSEFDLLPESTSLFLQAAEGRYNSEAVAPYHNKIHAADVVQTVFVMMTNMGFQPFFDAMDQLVSVLAAVIHDVGHDGKSNSYHIDMHDEMALLYNDQSLLENHALTTCFRLLNDAERGTNMLAGLSREQYRIARKEIVDMVLATDMAVHYQVCEKFQDSVTQLGQDPERWHAKDEAMYAMRALVLHSSDISNLAKPLNLSTQWTSRCLQELFLQGDAERRAGLPISPLCDRFSVDVASSQIGFSSIIVQPTYEHLARLMPKVREVCLAIAARNHSEWCARKRRKTDVEELQSVLRRLPSDAGGEAANGPGDDAEARGEGPLSIVLGEGDGDVVELVDNTPGRCGCWAAPVVEV